MCPTDHMDAVCQDQEGLHQDLMSFTILISNVFVKGPGK